MRERLRQRLPILLSMLTAVLLLLLSGIGCPFRFFLGVSCPGCGMTRACLSLVSASKWAALLPPYEAPAQPLLYNLRAALAYHPLVVVVPPALLYALLAKRPYLGTPRREKLALGALAGLMIAVWLVRLGRGDPVVAIDLNEGFMIQLWGRISTMLGI